MNAQERVVAEEFNRRFKEIWGQFDEAIKVPNEAIQAAMERKDRALEELRGWYAENYDGLKE